MTTKKGFSDPLARGVVVFHKWLIGAGGAERLAVEEYRYFSKCGVPTRLIAFQADPAALFDLGIEHVEVIPNEGSLDGLLRLRRRLRELNPALIISAGGLRDLFLSTLFLNIPYIIHQHEAPFKMLLMDRLHLVRLLRWNVLKQLRNMAYGYRVIPVSPIGRSLIGKVKDEILSLIDAVVWRRALIVTLLSNRAVKEMELLYGKEAVALYGCVSEEMLSHEADGAIAATLGLQGKKIVLSISRLAPMKRIDVAIEAFACVAADNDDLVLVLGGCGPSEPALHKLAERLDVSEKVHFIGFVPEGEICDFMAMGDVFVCLDWTDFDIAPYEAMAQGCRVVWTNEIETSEWLESSGVVFPVKPTVESVAEGMQRALATPEPSRPAIVQYLRPYTWDGYFERIRQLAIEKLSGSPGYPNNL
ncbi:MAG: glycosyltransferase [Syntrophus sp. (in: bacteria)]